MMKKIRFASMKKGLVGICFLSALWTGCSTDFDVIAPYKEIMVIDGLLNANDTMQSIRIQKAYLGEGNAYVMAQVSDSINYGNVLDVQIDRLLNNQVIENFALTRSELHNKDSGIFAYPFHVVYTTNHPIVTGDNSQYRIRVTNTQTGTVASASTRIVKDIIFKSPLPPRFDPDPLRDTLTDLGEQWTAPFNVIFAPGVNSRIYDMVIRFNYREVDASGNSSFHKVDWNFSDKTSINLPAEVNFKFFQADFMTVLGVNIPDKAGYTRRTDSLQGKTRPIDFIIIAGTEELQTYYLLHLPTSGIVQEVPNYTNVDNGLGLFSSRIIHSTSYFLSDVFEDSLKNSIATRSKNFEFN